MKKNVDTSSFVELVLAYTGATREGREEGSD
jgi:hypothetical protein